MTIEVIKTRFKKEKEEPYRPAEGSWESVLMLVKDRFVQETCGMGEMEFWQPIEERATMTPEQGCFQYYLAGTGHRTLAEWIVCRFNLSAPNRQQRIDEVASVLYDRYPQEYRKRIKE